MKLIERTPIWLFLLLSLAGCKILPLAPSSTNLPTASTKLVPTSTNQLPVSAISSTPFPTRDISALPAFENLANGWTELFPGGETACARGGIYSFSVRKTKSSKLLVYFEGGGSCYDAKTCRVGGNYFDDSIELVV